MTKNYTSFTSESLFRLLQKDDSSAFEELYNRYWHELFIAAYKRLQCREDAEEAVQNLYESLWKNRHKIHIRTSLENYLFASVRYIILRMMQQKLLLPAFSDGNVDAYCKPDRSTEEGILINDLSRHINQLVDGLPDKCRKVFELSRYEMKTHKEISTLLSISEKTVENHITKALHLIKNDLNHFFFL
ncbi:MAG: RNA polymerase sigma-70 factor [Chitinophagaceae bacterium]|nr:MAG: RNA polymerase sigma-70 factor [Chitinophagaceae bacterium]